MDHFAVWMNIAAVVSFYISSASTLDVDSEESGESIEKKIASRRMLRTTTTKATSFFKPIEVGSEESAESDEENSTISTQFPNALSKITNSTTLKISSATVASPATTTLSSTIKINEHKSNLNSTTNNSTNGTVIILTQSLTTPNKSSTLGNQTTMAATTILKTMTKSKSTTSATLHLKDENKSEESAEEEKAMKVFCNQNKMNFYL